LKIKIKIPDAHRVKKGTTKNPNKRKDTAGW
jgi:hypothetical protein